MDKRQEFGKRLREAMKAAGYEDRPGVLLDQFTQRHWGEPVSFQTASKWLNGKSIPQEHRLIDIAEWLGVEPQVLRYGEKAVHAARDRNKQREELAYAERETLDALMRLSPEHRNLVRLIIKGFAETVGASKPSSAKPRR